jgi:tRNA-Thr(GGU) m(6)t(6)A37 methyltransferase TsaA
MTPRRKLKPIRPIGFVRSRRQDKGGREESRVQVLRPYARGLRGLERSSHAIIVFQMNRAPFSLRRHLLSSPCYDHRFRKVGIFSLRCGHRPNRLGVTVVEVVGVENDTLTVTGLDALRGSPVLDIKPYVPSWDARFDAVRIPDWLVKLNAF